MIFKELKAKVESQGGDWQKYIDDNQTDLMMFMMGVDKNKLNLESSDVIIDINDSSISTAEETIGSIGIPTNSSSIQYLNFGARVDMSLKRWACPNTNYGVHFYRFNSNIGTNNDNPSFRKGRVSGFKFDKNVVIKEINMNDVYSTSTKSEIDMELMLYDSKEHKLVRTEYKKHFVNRDAENDDNNFQVFATDIDIKLERHHTLVPVFRNNTTTSRTYVYIRSAHVKYEVI